MSCFKPLPAYRSREINPTGKRSLVFKSRDWIWSSDANRLREAGELLMMPCGQCIGCRLKYSRNWAVRCMQESLSFDNNIFNAYVSP